MKGGEKLTSQSTSLSPQGKRKEKKEKREDGSQSLLSLPIKDQEREGQKKRGREQNNRIKKKLGKRHDQTLPLSC